MDNATSLTELSTAGAGLAIMLAPDNDAPALDVTAGDFRLVFDSRGLRVIRISDSAPLLVVTGNSGIA